MKVLPRTKFGNPILRQKAKPVDPKQIRTPAFQELLKEMFFTMRKVAGVGLAAPQIGIPQQFAVIECVASKWRPGLKGNLKKVIINPKILKYSKEKMEDWEGCLSLSPVRGRVPRAKSIVVEYLDEDGVKHKETYQGFPARVFQHEIDHLNGVLYVDRMPNMRTLMDVEEFTKRILKR